MSPTERVVLTAATVEDTEAIGRRVGTLAQPGDVIALTGDLGAGKTAFVRGLADGLGVPTHMVASPTFTMVAEAHEYRETLALNKMSAEEREKYYLRPSERAEDEVDP